MTHNNTETQQKIDALASYIHKQLAAGVKPKELYQHLVEKKVPAKTAASLIEQAMKQRQPQSSPPPAPAQPNNDRQQKIKTFIQAQLDAGKQPQQILTLLVNNKVPREEAITLIQETAKPAAPPKDRVQHDFSVSPSLPESSIISPEERLNSPTAFVAAQLNQGVELKAIVDQLVADGMPRNQAIDLVVNFNEKQKGELIEPGMANRSEMAKKGRNKMLIGLAALVGGGLITIASYSAAEPGGTYFLYGPMIYGAIAAVSGFVQWTRHM